MKTIGWKWLGLLVATALLGACASATDNSSSDSGTNNTPSTAATVLDRDYESSAGSLYLAQGTDNGDNGTLATIDGHNALKLNAASVEQYGTKAVIIQDDLTATTDLSGQTFTVDLDLYLPAGSPVTILQYIFVDTANGYHGIYGGYTNADLPSDAWKHYTFTVNAANIGYDATNSVDQTATPANWTTMDKFRLQLVTTNAGDNVVAYIDNVKVSKP